MSFTYRSLFAKKQKVAIVFLCHLAVIALIVAGIYLLELEIHYFWSDHAPLIFGRIPLAYLFQALDVAIVLVFAYRGIREIDDILRG